METRRLEQPTDADALLREKEQWFEKNKDTIIAVRGKLERSIRELCFPADAQPSSDDLRDEVQKAIRRRIASKDLASIMNILRPLYQQFDDLRTQYRTLITRYRQIHPQGARAIRDEEYALLEAPALPNAYFALADAYEAASKKRA